MQLGKAAGAAMSPPDLSSGSRTGGRWPERGDGVPVADVSVYRPGLCPWGQTAAGRAWVGRVQGQACRLWGPCSWGSCPLTVDRAHGSGSPGDICRVLHTLSPSCSLV